MPPAPVPVTLATLIASATKTQIYQKVIDLCSMAGLNTESWQSGDPTRTTIDAMSGRSAEFEDPDNGFPAMIKGGLLGLARGGWLTLLLQQNYNVTRRAATYAQCTVTITNPTGADFGAFDADDLTCSNPHTPTSPTYRNDDPFTLGPMSVATFTVTAEIAGSGGNAIVADIDTIISPGLPGCMITNTTAAVANDEENDDDATARGQSKLESTSPGGPRGAYTYAITTPEEQSDGSNQTNVTRVRVIEESDYGDALIFIAGPSGALAGSDVTKAQNTIEAVANPFVVNGQVLNTSNLTQAITYELWAYDDINLTQSDAEALIATALANAFEALSIGGSIIPPATSGYIYVDWIRARITDALDSVAGAPSDGYTFKVSITVPATDVPLAIVYNSATPSSSTAQVAVLGTLTCTALHLVPRT